MTAITRRITIRTGNTIMSSMVQIASSMRILLTLL
jgi:hypothetical protein